MEILGGRSIAIDWERYFEQTWTGGRGIYSQILIEEGHCEGSF
jgi:hypothetical protein